MRSPELELEGYEIFAPVEAFDALWETSLRARATPAGLAMWEIARVEAGRPEWGIDMDDATIAQAWGRLVARAEGAGQRMSVMDGFIAATAHIHELTLVTRNARDFTTAGVSVLNPWTG